ncbi:hypothetical protein [Streptomyces sp. NBC_01092]|uniref:hypothetical protein n=1 Tax=Streptomyces sp. NBC_01092 TaxID=2903748 RepID=UPI0038684476|nr:hypothetical protein OG254_21905 [Streptomyces sp. NBC_01092]
MSNWNPGGQPPHDPHVRQPYPPQPGPYPPPPAPPGAGHPPHVPHPYTPQPYPPHPQPPYPGPPPAPGFFTRLWQRFGPIHVARRVFKPSRPGIVEDPVVAQMQRIRTWVGLAAVVWMSITYKIADSIGDAVDKRADQSWTSVLVLSVTFPVAVGILLSLVPATARRELLRRAAKPFGAIVALIGAVFVFPVVVLTGFVEGRFATNPAMTAVTVIVCVVIFVWVVPFIVWGVGLALVHVFRTADIHETMPPLLAMTLVWELALIDLFTGAYAGVPTPVRILLMLGAPVSVTAVGLWELSRLRSRHGLVVRDLLMREGTPGPAPSA